MAINAGSVWRNKKDDRIKICIVGLDSENNRIFFCGGRDNVHPIIDVKDLLENYEREYGDWNI